MFCHRIAESCVIIDSVLSFQIQKYIMSNDELHIKILHYEVSSSFDESDYLFFCLMMMFVLIIGPSK